MYRNVSLPVVTILLLGLGAGISASPASAAPARPRPLAWCGADDPTRLAVLVADHLAHERRRELARLAGGASASAPTVSAAGNVAVLRDDGSLVSDINLFDFAGRGLQFRRRGARLIAAPSGAGVAGNLGERLELDDDDTVELVFPARFKFNFYGQTYSSIFVNSDGNLSFTEGDDRHSRSLGDLINGPPRIAPFFADLDPSVATGDGGVYARVLNSKIQITWWRLPEFGTSNENTIQVTLARNGRITVAYGELAAREAVVGATPGRGTLVELLDFSSELPFGPAEMGLAERFSNQQEVDDLAVSSTFFQHFRDQYDHLVVFLDFPHSLQGAFAYSLTVKNDIEGIGHDPDRDLTDLFGSPGRLETFLQMGSLANYPADPGQTVFGHFSGLDVVAHEAGHRWLSRAHFDLGAGASDELLGRQRVHWSFFMDTDASVMEGNDLRDNGDGSFTTVAAVEGYSALDLYMMGLVGPEQVPPFFYVAGAQGATRESAPQVGVRLRGNRVNLTLDDIIAAEGPRRPSVVDSPKSFNIAFALLTRAGAEPSATSLAKVDLYRQRFATFFNQITGGRASLDTTLVPK